MAASVRQLEFGVVRAYKAGGFARVDLMAEQPRLDALEPAQPSPARSRPLRPHQSRRVLASLENR